MLRSAPTSPHAHDRLASFNPKRFTVLRSLSLASCVLSSCLLLGCTSGFVHTLGTPSDVVQENFRKAKARRQAALEAKQAVSTAARADKLQRIMDYLEGEGAERPATARAGLESKSVVLGMTQAEVLLVANAVGGKSVTTTFKGVFATWTGVDASGPSLDTFKSLGHKGPLTVVFGNGRVSRVSSEEN